MKYSLTFIKRELAFKALSYSILIFTLFIAVIFPTYLQLIGGYAIPTATYAYNILYPRTAYISENGGTDYWSYALVIEGEYPIPSLLLAIYSIVLNIPTEYRVFQPVVGIASIVYFAFALRVLSFGRIKRSHILFLAAVYYIYIVTDYLHAQYLGRAALGVVLLIYWFLSLLTTMCSHNKEGLIVLIILSVSLGLTYYTSTLTICLSGAVLYLLLKLTKLFIRESSNEANVLYKYLYLFALIGIFFLVIRPMVTPKILSDLSLEKFLNNFIEYVKVQLKIEYMTEAYFLNVGFTELDPVTRLLNVRFRFFVRFLTVLILLVIFLRIIISIFLTKKRLNHLEMYIVMAFIAFCSELAYVFYASTFSWRFLSIYGLPVFLYIIFLLAKAKSVMKFFNRVFPMISVIILTMMVVASISSVYVAQQYGVAHAKLHGNRKIEGISNYLSKGCVARLTIVTDSYYSALLYYKMKISNNTIIVEPLGQIAITLYFVCNDLSLYNDLIEQLQGRCLLIVNNETIYGDPWGYAVKISEYNIMHLFNLIYSDPKFQLLIQR